MAKLFHMLSHVCNSTGDILTNWKGIKVTSCPRVLQSLEISHTGFIQHVVKTSLNKNYSRCFGIRPLPITHPLKNGGESNIQGLRRNCTFFIFFFILRLSISILLCCKCPPDFADLLDVFASAWHIQLGAAEVPSFLHAWKAILTWL